MHVFTESNLPEYSARRLWCTSWADRRISPTKTVTAMGTMNASVQFMSPPILQENRHSLLQEPLRCTRTYWFGRCLWSMSGSFVLKSRSKGGSCLINHPASHIKLDSALRKSKMSESVSRAEGLTSLRGMHGPRSQSYPDGSIRSGCLAIPD